MASAPRRLSPHAAVAVPAGAVVAMLLGLLQFDFQQGVGGPLLAHLGAWLLRGAGLALLASPILRWRSHPAVAVAAGLAGGGLGFALGGAGSLLFSLGAGIVVAALVQVFSTLEAGDVAPATLMSLFFFLVITAFWIAKPIKKGLLVGWYKDHPFHLFGRDFTGAGAEQWAKVGNMLVAALAMTAFTWLSRRLHRERLVFLFAGVFSVVFLYFWRHLAQADEGVAWQLYLGGDLFNTVMLATFFAFLNDSVVASQARRIYALVVFGGVLGGVVGSTSVRSLQKTVGDRPLMMACAVATVGMALVAAAAAARFRGGMPRAAPAPVPAAGNAAFEGARLVFRSRYLLCLVAIVGIYEFCSATLDYQWTATHERLLVDAAAIRHHQATVYAITNWAAMLVQLLLTGPLLRRFGVGAALLVLPGVFLVNSGAFLLWPAVLTAAGLSVSDNALNYSLNQSAKEALYVPASREEKYKAKAFIDMFVQRFAKAVAVVLALGFNLLGPAWTRWLTVPVLLLLVGWIAAARYAGRRFDELTEAS